MAFESGEEITATGARFAICFFKAIVMNDDGF
jgi:hypothetical protein